MTDKKNRRSLQKYIFDKKKATECFICNLDEKDEIDKARASGAKLNDVADWLVSECGHDRKFIKLKMKQMSTHLNNHITEDGKDDWEAKL